jgi:DNA ligase-1
MLGQPSDWVAQSFYQGIHVQARVLKKGIQLWTRNEELLPDVFPEVRNAASYFEEGTLLIAELMVKSPDDQSPGYFPNLIKRIQSKKSRHDLMVQSPVQLLVQDMLFDGTRDLRALPFIERSKRLAAKMKDIDDVGFQYSSAIDFSNWEELEAFRANIRSTPADGISLQKRNDPWNTQPLFKLKPAAFELNAVLLYVSKIPDKNKKIITECGFGVWREGPSNPQELISITRCSEGLSSDEIKELDAWVKTHTRERFGPVRSVEAERVFQLQFDAIQTSRRHKSGLLLQNVRMKIPREPLTIQQAGTLEQLNALIAESN